MTGMDKQNTDNRMTGAEIVLRALKDNGVKHIFGYPGGAVLPIYDEIFVRDWSSDVCSSDLFSVYHSTP